MDFFMKFLLLLCMSVYALASAETTKSPVPSGSSGRTGRKNYNVWQPPRDYGDDGDDKDAGGDDADQGPGNGKPPQGYDYPNFGNYKGFDPYSNYGPPRFPSYPPNFKGYPLYPTFWKDNKPGDSESSPDIMSMMLALNNMDGSAKPDDGGILSKLVSDPKSAAVAAIIPLSIVAAAVVPVLMNYMMTGVSSNNSPTITTTATDNKNGRSLDVFNNFDFVLEGIANFARSMDSDECVQKTVCRVATGDESVSVPEYVRKAATKIFGFVNDDIANNFGVQSILEGVKQGNCNNVCSNYSRKVVH